MEATIKWETECTSGIAVSIPLDNFNLYDLPNMICDLLNIKNMSV